MLMKHPGRHAGEPVRYQDPDTDRWFIGALSNRERRTDGSIGWAVTVTDPGTYLAPTEIGSRQHLADQQLVPLARRQLPAPAAVAFIGSLVIIVALIVVSGISFLAGNNGGGYQAMTSAVVILVITGWFANWWRQT